MLLVVDSISNEKNVEKEIIFKAIEKAIAAVTARKYPEEVSIVVGIDRRTGDYKASRQWDVVDSSALPLEFPGQQMLLEEAQEKFGKETNIGDIVEIEVEPAAFGRIAAQHAKQVIVRELRIAERLKIADFYNKKLNTLMVGIVKKVMRDSILLDMGNNVEGLISKENLIPHEEIRAGDRVRAILIEVSEEPKGPQLIFSRTHRAMVVELFKIEVPEIGEEVIEIKAVSRDPGSRSKLAVKTNDGRIDPIGACIGIRGSRVQTVSSELNGERIDVVSWSDNPAQLVVNAMAPAEIASISMDEAKKSMSIGVREDQLALAIGRNGQNVRLASELSGWKLNVYTEAELEKKSKTEGKSVSEMFISNLGVDEELATILVQEGFRSLEDVAYVSDSDMLSIEGFDKELVEELRTRARNSLLKQALTSSIDVGAAEPAQDLLEMESMTRHLAYVLASKGVITREDLAEKSVDELSDIEGLDKDMVAKLIMIARKPWFEKE